MLHAAEVTMTGSTGAAWDLASTWSDAAVPSSGNNYSVTGKTLNSPTLANTATATFNGGALSISSGGLTLTGTSSGTVTQTYNFPNLTTPISVSGSTISFSQTNNTTQNFNGALSLSGSNIITMAASSFSGHTVDLKSPITGSGTVTFNTTGAATGRNYTISSTTNNFTGTAILNTSAASSVFNLNRSLGATAYEIRNNWRLNNSVAGALNSASTVTLFNSGSTLNLSSSSWANTSANLTLTAGSVILGNGANAGSASIGNLTGAAGAITTVGTAASVLTINQTTDGTYAGTFTPVSGSSLGLVKNGTSRLTFSKATPFASGGGTVPLTMNNGTLAIGNGTTTFATTTAASLTQTGGDLHFDLNATTADALTLTGNYTRSAGGIIVQVSGSPALGTPYTLITYGGTLSANPSVTFQGLAGTRITGSSSFGTGSNSAITVTFGGAPANLVWTGATDNAWDQNSTSNWLNGAAADKFLTYDNVTFDDSATSGNLSPTLSATLVPTSVTFANSDAKTYNLGGTGAIGGAATLAKTNTGTAIITTPNTYTGATTVNGGVLQVGDGSATGNLGTGVISVNGASLVFKRPDTVTVANNLSGNGTIIHEGAGTLALTGTSSISGSYVAASGVLQVGDGNSNTPGASVSGASGITVQTGAILDLPRLHVSTTQEVTWALPPVSIQSGGTLRFRASTGTNNHAVAAYLSVSGNTTIDNSGGSYGQNITYSGDLSGSGLITSLTADSSIATTVRTLTMNAANSAYSGSWLVQHANTGDDYGALAAGAANALGSGTVTLSTRAQLFNNATGGLNSLTGITLNEATSSVFMNSRNWTNPAAVLTVTDGAVNAGGAVLSIASASQAAGTINLDLNATSNGALAVTGNASFTGGAINTVPTVNPAGKSWDIVTYGSLTGTPFVNTGDTGRLTATVDNGSGTNDNITVSFNGTVGNLVWTGNTSDNWDNNLTDNFLNGATPDMFRNYDNVLFNDDTTFVSPQLVGAITAGVVTFNHFTNDYTLGGSGSLAGGTSIVKSGTGTLTISNSSANTYNGAVTINAGTLRAGTATALGGTTGGTTISTGGTLDLNALNLGSETITLSGGTIINANATQQQQAFNNLTVTASSVIGGTSRWDVRGASAVSTINSGATLTKQDANTVYLGVNGSVVNNGSIQVNAGLLGLYQCTVSGGGTMTANAAGTLAIENGTTNPQPVTLAGGTFGSTSGTVACTQSGNITLTANNSVIRATATTALNIDGNVSESGGSYGVTVPSLGGVVTFNGTTGFTGGLVVASSNTTDNTATTVNLPAGSSLTVASGKPVQVGRNTGTGATNSQTLNTTGAVANSGTLIIGRSGFLNLNNGAAWTQGGSMEVNGQGGYTATMNVNAGAAFTYAGTSTIKINPGTSGFGYLYIDGTFTTNKGFETTVTGGTSYAVTLRNGGTLKLSANVTDLTSGATNKTQFLLGTGGGLIDTNGFDTTIASNISGTGNSLTKQGAGTLTLSGTNSYTGATTVNGGTLAGTGAPGSALTVASAATLAPGNGIGTFACAGASIASGSTLAVQINSTAVTADKLLSTAPVNITGVIANFTDLGSGIITAGTKLVIADYTGTTLTGTFGGYAEGATVSVGSNTFTLSYADTSRITLTSTTSASPYDSWATTKGLDGTPGKNPAFDADPENDGIANGLEWILGGNPLAQDAASLVTVSATAAAGLTLTFNREEDSIGQAVLTVETDTDLAGPWSTFATVGATGSGSVTINTTPDPDAVTVNIPASNAVAGKLFARLKAVKP
jgi:autotransporter-associated beta strand protein